MSDSVLVVVVMAAALLLCLGGMLLCLRMCLHRVPPDSVLVVQGRSYHGRGFKVVSAPRVLVMPVIEQATILSLAPRPVKLELDGLLTSDQQRLRLEASVFVGVLPQEPEIANAVERFLGSADETIALVARETLEGTWRQVVVSSSQELLLGDLERTVQTLMDEAEPELAKLGLGLQAFSRFRLRDASGKTQEGGFDRQRAAEVARRARGERPAAGGRRY